MSVCYWKSNPGPWHARWTFFSNKNNNPVNICYDYKYVLFCRLSQMWKWISVARIHCTSPHLWLKTQILGYHLCDSTFLWLTGLIVPEPRCFHRPSECPVVSVCRWFELSPQMLMLWKLLTSVDSLGLLLPQSTRGITLLISPQVTCTLLHPDHWQLECPRKTLPATRWF